jgi:hypothetical protein
MVELEAGMTNSGNFGTIFALYKPMKKLLVFLFALLSISAFSQENTRGTIKVSKGNQVYAIMFDNINNRLIGKDHYGNLLDSAVTSFSVQVTIKGISYKEDVVGTTLSSVLQQRITRVDGATTLFFYNIQVKGKNGAVIDWPKFTARIGYSYEQTEN